MTELTYQDNSYLKEIETSVLEVLPGGVVTKKTIFYPLGGGQDHDVGKIILNQKEYEVRSVEKIGLDVLHKIDMDQIRDFKDNDEVKLVIDWKRRYRFMKYHTAAHLLSAVVYQDTGALITGNQIKEDKGRIDFNLETFDRDKISEYEKKANILIKESHEVNIYELDRKEAMQVKSIFKLRDVFPKSLKKFRIVSIEGVDEQACGGTHVKNTSEIGSLKIIKAENKGKDNRRIYFSID